MLDAEPKEQPKKEEKQDGERSSDDDKVVAVDQQSLWPQFIRVCMQEVVCEIGILVLSSPFICSRIEAEPFQDSGVVKKTPFETLNFVDLLENSRHGLTVEAVMELEKEHVIEDTKKVEERRDEPSSSWDGDRSLHDVHEG